MMMMPLRHLSSHVVGVKHMLTKLKERRGYYFFSLLARMTLTYFHYFCVLTLTAVAAFSSFQGRHLTIVIFTTIFLIRGNFSVTFVSSWVTPSYFMQLPRMATSQTIVLHNPRSHQSPPVVHFIFLVHGYKGRAADLSYLQQNLKNCIKLEDNTCKTVVIHNAMTNEFRTNDGIEKGGERLFHEILHVIRKNSVQESGSDSSPTLATISIIGNSLGGVYSRYAIAKLSAMSSGDKSCSSFTIDHGSIRIYYNIFCTTATPHLGIARNTWLTIPRLLEISIAHILGDTGKDLFLVTDIMKKMTTDTYLRPLKAFRSRILYANAYGTDFVVPCTTAAFLHQQSTYPHHSFSDNDTSYSNLFVATLHTFPTESFTNTPSNESNTLSSTSISPTTNNNAQVNTVATPPWITTFWNLLRAQTKLGDEYNAVDENLLLSMSHALDSLGWRKIFVDVREEIPLQVPVRKLSRVSSKNDTDLCFNLRTGRKNVFESRDIAQAFSFPEKKISLPIGHNMMVAFSRTPWSSFVYKGGRPIMDQLASEFVKEMFQWRVNEGDYVGF